MYVVGSQRHQQTPQKPGKPANENYTENGLYKGSSFLQTISYNRYIFNKNDPKNLAFVGLSGEAHAVL